MKIEAVVNNDVVFRTGPRISSGRGRKGDLAPSFEMDTETAAGIERVLNYRVGARNLELPLNFQAATRQMALDTIDDVLTSLAGGNVILRFTSSAGRRRELHSCYLKDGLKEDGFENYEDTLGAQAVLTFFCSDPYWYDATTFTKSFKVEPPATTFFPFFPLKLLASAILGEDIVNNPGITVQPVWSIRGPGTDITIQNKTTGKQLTWLGTLAITDTLEINTLPLVKTVTKNGINAYSGLVRSSQFFPIAPGDNQISVQISSTTTDTECLLSFQPRYMSL
jgi:phage-related protein